MPRSKVTHSLIPKLWVDSCPMCSDSSEHKRTIVKAKMRVRCHACGVRLRPIYSRRLELYWLHTTDDPHFPGLFVFVCEDCAKHCDACRYDFDE